MSVPFIIVLKKKKKELNMHIDLLFYIYLIFRLYLIV